MPRIYEWDAPAKLYHWPSPDAQEGEIYSTLAAALTAAAEGESSTAWIITQNGDILTPGLINALQEELPRRPGRRPWRSRLFGEARAA